MQITHLVYNGIAVLTIVLSIGLVINSVVFWWRFLRNGILSFAGTLAVFFIVCFGILTAYVMSIPISTSQPVPVYVEPHLTAIPTEETMTFMVEIYPTYTNSP